ncbi:MAG: sulfurtransferase TusA family protein [Sulfobacillus thermosulfidooxidans]|uniref:SirA family protein n=1 Tax=Sulfobacillus thermotolerans TaxID=338644 RepID=A0ABN5H004_9FIRM|nr:sulfurtransferase TusA family protein [Sulfobacillus sp. hq2]AUW92763.1 SirA family protein [Sulfobacillus thermotolerans]MCY0909348.1 sulfurtransferase TusA family protein [Sulfobacillus thermotolerans]POB12007.1 SirA family protein [Sulfobacillus sp. hq2]PSR36418.1 MAG: sulfurtransferase TusA family protein [Sulfobacillus thermosulfidooxidans]
MEQVVDVRGLSCPMPIIKTKKAMDQIQPGDALVVLATDPGAVADFQAYARRTGHKLLQAEQVEKEFHFKLEKV